MGNFEYNIGDKLYEFAIMSIVRACLEFSPYTHFYTQVLIDIIVKTYNSKVFRTDLLFKSQIGVLIENPKKNNLKNGLKKLEK